MPLQLTAPSIPPISFSLPTLIARPHTDTRALYTALTFHTLRGKKAAVNFSKLFESFTAYNELETFFVPAAFPRKFKSAGFRSLRRIEILLVWKKPAGKQLKNALSIPLIVNITGRKVRIPFSSSLAYTHTHTACTHVSAQSAPAVRAGRFEITKVRRSRESQQSRRHLSLP